MKRWFALYVQPRKEKVVEQELLKRGYEIYLPIKQELRQWKDRKRIIEVPLIPSYVFMNIEEKEVWDIVRINGCVKFIWFNGKPCPIPDNQIDSIKLLLENKVEIKQTSINPSSGDLVRIIEGDFTGLVGVFLHKKENNNFAVRISSLGIDLTITIDESKFELVE